MNERNGKYYISNVKLKKEYNFSNLITFVEDRPGHDVSYGIDSSELKKQLKWNKVTNIDKGLSQTIKWYSENQRFFKITSSKIFNKRLGLKLWKKF